MTPQEAISEARATCENPELDPGERLIRVNALLAVIAILVDASDSPRVAAQEPHGLSSRALKALRTTKPPFGNFDEFAAAYRKNPRGVSRQLLRTYDIGRKTVKELVAAVGLAP